MKKRNIALLGFSLALGYFVKNRKSLRSLGINNDGQQNKKSHSIIEDTGRPDQVEHKDQAQLENAKMVSEGSQYGVQYYNKIQEKSQFIEK